MRLSKQRALRPRQPPPKGAGPRKAGQQKDIFMPVFDGNRVGKIFPRECRIGFCFGAAPVSTADRGTFFIIVLYLFFAQLAGNFP